MCLFLATLVADVWWWRWRTEHCWWDHCILVWFATWQRLILVRQPNTLQRSEFIFFCLSSWISGFSPLASQPASSRKKQRTKCFKSCFGGIWVARFSMDNPRSCCKMSTWKCCFGKKHARGQSVKAGKKTEVLTWRPLRGWCHPNFDKSSIAAEGIKWTCQKEIKKKRERGKRKTKVSWLGNPQPSTWGEEYNFIQQ